MSAEQEKWDRLVKLARQAPQAPEPEMPFGFATRVVANWPQTAAAGPSLEAIWEGLSLRFLGIALAIMVVTLTFSYDSIGADSDQPVIVSLTDSALDAVLQP